MALMVTVGCAGSEPGGAATPEPSDGATPAAATPPSTGATPTTAAPPSTSAPTPPRAVTIAVAGDVHFEGVLRSRLDDPATALAPVTSTLAAADVAIVNLETSVGTGGEPEPGKRYTFQAPPSAFSALAEAGIDVATMANNHALDFGREPLMAALDANAADAASSLDVVGVGRNADEAFRPAITDVAGTVVATIAATVADDDPSADPTGLWAATATSPGTADAINPTRLLRAVANADRSADVVVVYMHWGVQGEQCPNDSQRALATALVGAGADVVVGSHAHRLQGSGQLGDGYVAYGLGNYAWYTQASKATSTTGALTLTIQPAVRGAGSHATVTDAVWEPARLGPDGLPTPMTGSDAAEFDDDLAVLRTCAGLDP